jgi:hypothetical protein
MAKRLKGETGTIKDRDKILFAAVKTGSVPTFLYDPAILEKMCKEGLLSDPQVIADFKQYRITEKGRTVFSEGGYGRGR